MHALVFRFPNGYWQSWSENVTRDEATARMEDIRDYARSLGHNVVIIHVVPMAELCDYSPM